MDHFGGEKIDLTVRGVQQKKTLFTAFSEFFLNLVIKQGRFFWIGIGVSQTLENIIKMDR